jgi:hypothetical protein
MKRLIYCVLAGAVAVAPGPCFGQAIGESIQIQANTPAPAMPGSSRLTSGRLRARRSQTAASGQIITIAKGHYQLPPKKANAGSAEPFVVYGGDDDNDDGIKAPAQSAPQPQVAPVKAQGAPSPTQKAPSQKPPP